MTAGPLLVETREPGAACVASRLRAAVLSPHGSVSGQAGCTIAHLVLLARCDVGVHFLIAFPPQYWHTVCSMRK